MYKILSIDGGGIRGIIPGKVLEQVEKLIQEKYKDPGKRISDCFDLIAGTSTGGILTCLYRYPDTGLGNRPKYSAKDITNIYVSRGKEIFNIPLGKRLISAGGITDEKYPSTGIERVLTDYFSDLWVSELLGDVLITAYDIKDRQAVFFRKVQEADKDFKVRDICRATSAAPTYFEAAKIKSEAGISLPAIDGGMFANNPSLCAYADAVSRYNISGVKEMAILSLGTGFKPKEYDYNKVKDWGLVNWVRPVIDILMSSQVETSDYQLRQIYNTLGVEFVGQYLRVNEELPGYINEAMDDANKENINNLVKYSDNLVENNNLGLKEFVDKYL